MIDVPDLDKALERAARCCSSPPGGAWSIARATGLADDPAVREFLSGQAPP